MTRFSFARNLVAALAVLGGLAAPGLAQQPGAAVAQLEAFPADINLTTARDRQSVVIQATYADGITRDVTKEAKLAIAKPALVRLEGSTCYPVADGATTLAVEFGGRSLTLPVKVAQATAQPPL